MSGIGFWEFFFLCMIGLVVLGPKRLPQVANQLGTWIGQARRMTRVLKRQLEEELDLGSELNVRPSITPARHPPPRDDDGYSPLHQQPAAAGTAVDQPAPNEDGVSDDRSDGASTGSPDSERTRDA